MSKSEGMELDDVKEWEQARALNAEMTPILNKEALAEINNENKVLIPPKGSKIKFLSSQKTRELF